MLMNSSPPDIYPVPLIDPYINSCYGPRWGRCHSGVDLKTKGVGDSQPLIAACAGTVTRAVDDAGDCGGYIKIECNSGHAVGYCHLKVVNKNLYGIDKIIKFKINGKVVEGKVIGLVDEKSFKIFERNGAKRILKLTDFKIIG